MPPNRAPSTDQAIDSAYVSSEDDANLFAFKEQHCFNCYVLNSEIDNYLMQCGKCQQFYYCGMACFNAHLPVHMQYCQTGNIYYEPERRAGESTQRVKAPVLAPSKIKRQSSNEEPPRERRPSDRLWAAFNDSSSSSSSDDSDLDSSNSGHDSVSSEASFVETPVVRIVEENTDDRDSSASWSDEEEVVDEPETLDEVESDDDDEKEVAPIACQPEEQVPHCKGQARMGVVVKKETPVVANATISPTIENAVVAKPDEQVPHYKGKARLGVTARSDKAVVTKAPITQEETVEPSSEVYCSDEEYAAASGRGRFAHDDDEYEEEYSAKGRGRCGGTEWEECEEVSCRRGSAIIPQSSTAPSKGRRHTFCAPSLATNMNLVQALRANALKATAEVVDEDWSSASSSDSPVRRNTHTGTGHYSASNGSHANNDRPSSIQGSKWRSSLLSSPMKVSKEEMQAIRRKSDQGVQLNAHEKEIFRRMSLPQGQFQFLSDSFSDSDDDEEVILRHVLLQERPKPEFEKPEWSRKAPLRTTSKGERARTDGDLRKNRPTKPEEVWEKPEWVRKAPLRTSSRGARLKAGRSFRLERTGSAGRGIQALGGDLLPERKTPPRRSSKDGDKARTLSKSAPPRASSNSKKRSKQNSKNKGQVPVAENVRIENGQIMWEAPKLRSTIRGSLLHRQQSIRNSKCVGAMSASANAIKKMFAADFDSDSEQNSSPVSVPVC